MTEEEYFDLLDAERGRTTDAPEMTVGDSGSDYEHPTDETGGYVWICKTCGCRNAAINSYCSYCGLPRPKDTDK